MTTQVAALPLAPATENDFERWLTGSTRLLVMLLVAGLVTVIWISVFTRYVVNNPIAWGEQVAKYLMVWAAFLGASLGIRDGAHIAVNALVDRLPRVLQLAAGVAALLLTSAFLLGCVYYGTLFAMKVSSHSDPVVGEMSLAWPYAAIPVGSALMLVQLSFVIRRGAAKALSSGQASLS